jgi:hypothetical protein
VKPWREELPALVLWAVAVAAFIVFVGMWR